MLLSEILKAAYSTEHCCTGSQRQIDIIFFRSFTTIRLVHMNVAYNCTVRPRLCQQLIIVNAGAVLQCSISCWLSSTLWPVARISCRKFWHHHHHCRRRRLCSTQLHLPLVEQSCLPKSNFLLLTVAPYTTLQKRSRQRCYFKVCDFFTHSVLTNADTLQQCLPAWREFLLLNGHSHDELYDCQEGAELFKLSNSCSHSLNSGLDIQAFWILCSWMVSTNLLSMLEHKEQSYVLCCACLLQSSPLWGHGHPEVKADKRSPVSSSL